MNSVELKPRIKSFALRLVHLYEQFPGNNISKLFIPFGKVAFLQQLFIVPLATYNRKAVNTNFSIAPEKE